MSPGWLVDFSIDYNGDTGPNEVGEDIVYIFYNDNSDACIGIEPNHFGLGNADPSGFVAENHALHDWIFSK